MTSPTAEQMMELRAKYNIANQQDPNRAGVCAWNDFTKEAFAFDFSTATANERRVRELLERCERAEGLLKRAVKVCEDAMPWVAVMNSDHDPYRHPQSVENAKNDLAELINFVNEVKPGTFRPQGVAHAATLEAENKRLREALESTRSMLVDLRDKHLNHTAAVVRAHVQHRIEAVDKVLSQTEDKT